jgi:hypothetical protein
MNEKQEKEWKKRRKEKESEAVKLPECTTAFSAEHARGENDDDPCDDGRNR